jgi:hypothetical protein
MTGRWQESATGGMATTIAALHKPLLAYMVGVCDRRKGRNDWRQDGGEITTGRWQESATDESAATIGGSMDHCSRTWQESATGESAATIGGSMVARS